MTGGEASGSRTGGERTAYLVLGMHRSGTSAVTQLLSLAGARLPANVMPGDEYNQQGYFEPWKIAILNDERLRAAGSAWDDGFAFPFRPLAADDEALWSERARALFAEEYGRVRHPLMKDPRVTVLLPFWRKVLERQGVGARCVIPVRHPLAVAGSLQRRDGFPPEKSVLVWTAYMLAAEAYTRDLPRGFVAYDALLADWRGQVARIEAAHGAPLPKLDEKAARRIDQALSPDLRHNAGGGDLSGLGWSGDLAARVLDWFEAAARDARPARRILDEAAAEMGRRAAEMGPLVSPAARDLDVARTGLIEARRRAEHLEDVLTRQQPDLEAGWRARNALAAVEAELDAALAGEDPKS
ncbi:conserved hypothetical protein [Phenylobacterium zucineum HLK1]|uniref:Sulfotransferase family protein n=1 Tax=Phenylobacterium zucineum (strain HLK1) TaxID=450851 RepID=B4REF4_PHEZH|nr:sulfotransferase family protein [Phenylobacterium zucineum]ACG76896.1 conserved hypothetical protein [Phenylobacterium zucineum HLK1]